MDQLNGALREISARTGAVLVDLASYPVAGDPRLWSEDRLHVNALGHQRMAAAFAQALGLPGSNATWARPLPPSPATPLTTWMQSELRWCRQYFLPWIWRRLTGRRLGGGRRASRPRLRPVSV